MSESSHTAIESRPSHRAGRTGKIARLPGALRQQINQRLYDCELGSSIVKLLNSLPEVQSILNQLFKGRAINEHNLSEWRTGGYQDWLAKKEEHAFLAETASETMAETDLHADPSKKSAVDRVANWFLPHFVCQARTRFAATSGNEEARWKTILSISHELTRLRRDDRNADRARMARERHDAKFHPMPQTPSILRDGSQ